MSATPRARTTCGSTDDELRPSEPEATLSPEVSAELAAACLW